MMRFVLIQDIGWSLPEHVAKDATLAIDLLCSLKNCTGRIAGQWYFE